MNKLLILFRSITDVRIEVKIMGIAIGISLFALLVGVIGLMNMSKINRMSAHIYEKELVSLSHIKEAHINLICLARSEKNVMLAFTKKDKLHYMRIHNANEELYRSNIRDVLPLLHSEDEKAVLSKLESAWAEYSMVSKQVLGLAMMENLNKSKPSIELAMGPAREKINAVTDALEKLSRMQEETARKHIEEATAIYRSSQMLLTGTITGGIILAVSLGILLSFVITGPIKRAEAQREAAVEALRQSEERYRELSIVDELTQVYNSRHFFHQLKMEIDRVLRYGQHLTLLLFDLDDFKRFNDAYGHVEGDRVLRQLGQVVKRCLRQTDSAYRYGGEEFTILLPMTTGKDGTVTAERIRTEFRKETFSPAPGLDVHLTVSIGVAQYKPLEDMMAFVSRVDQLMYQGKKNGKDRVCIES